MKELGLADAAHALEVKEPPLVIGQEGLDRLELAPPSDEEPLATALEQSSECPGAPPTSLPRRDYNRLRCHRALRPRADRAAWRHRPITDAVTALGELGELEIFAGHCAVFDRSPRRELTLVRAGPRPLRRRPRLPRDHGLAGEIERAVLGSEVIAAAEA